MENKKSKTIQMIGEIPIDFGKVSLNKKKEKICGDYYTIIISTLKQNNHKMTGKSGIYSCTKTHQPFQKK